MGSNERRFKRNIHQSIYIAIGILLLLCVIFYARNLEQKQSHFYVSFKNPNGSNSHEFQLEIAKNASERAKGLMYRKEIDKFGGMIFVYAQESVQMFWMKNTYISLDILFLDKDWKVVGILPDVPVLNTDPRSVDAKSKAAIELLAGSAKAEGIQVGSTLVFEGTAPQAQE